MEKSKILLVDDEAINIKLLLNLLKHDYRIFAATNGKEAIEIANMPDKPDLILLDINMPKMDGYEVFSILKDDEQTADIPVIFVTAFNDVAAEERGLSLGAVDYITKPFRPTIVLARVKNQVKRAQAEAALKASQQQLALQNATKDKFFNIIAHDLKSPFNSILGFSALLRDNIGNCSQEEIYDFANSIYNSSENVYKLVENLLTWSRLQTGKIDFNPEKIILKFIVAEVVNVLELTAKLKNINIKYDIDENIVVHADRAMLFAVLRNLLNNAIKFTHNNGFVKLTCDCCDGEALITVSDNGVGMPASSLDKLFRIDANVKTCGTAQENGTGLGLLLCKEFVELHGGEIRVQSFPNIGSKFTFSLTLCQRQTTPLQIPAYAG